jgi:hypothetical protein
MKTNLFALGIALLVIFSTNSCKKESLNSISKESQTVKDQRDPKNEDSGIITPEDSLLIFSRKCYEGNKHGLLKYGTIAHKDFVFTCAKMLGLSDYRALIMRDAAIMPDVYQSGLDNLYNQQWSHAYIITKTLWGVQWLWGDADDDFNDNLNVIDGEGYNGKCARYYYSLGNKDLGDWYVGYACHYISDVSFVLHSTFPDLDMAIHHSDFETWMDNNWYSGHNFSSIVNGVPASSYYTISDLKAAIRNAAKASNYSYSTNGKLAWNNYKSSGFPTSIGSGNSNCIYYTRKMIEEATKWTGSAVKYALSTYNAW